MKIGLENCEFNKKEMLPIPKELDEDLVKKTEEHLEIIKDSLRDFVKRIQDEEPDMVIFLDKSARVFGEPIFKYLAEQKMLKMPEIRFYNDDYLKGLYLGGKLDKESVEEELSDLKNKKVFFLDETFSRGKGAATVKKAKDFLSNNEIFYFALTQDKGLKALKDFDAGLEEFNTWYVLPEEEHKRNLSEINDDNNFKIYDNNIGELFSREVSQLYVTEAYEDGRLRTVSKLPDGTPKRKNIGEKEITIPNVYDYDEGHEYPCDKEEYLRLKEKKKQNTIRIVKEKILETLKGK